MTSPLADCHLLDHIGLSCGSWSTGRGCGGGFLLKDLPELQALISSYIELAMVISMVLGIKLTSSGQHLSIWAETAVKNTGLVSWNLNIANQGWVAPDADGVVWEAAGANNFTVVRAPSEAGNLGSSIDAVDTSTGGGVPEVDVTVI